MTSSDFKKRCVELRLRGFTLGEIVRLVKRPKTSVHFHIQNLALSRSQAEAIKKKSKLNLIVFNQSRKGKSKRGFREFDFWNQRMVGLVAHLLFDGELKYSACVYNNRSRALVERVKDCMTDIYDYKPKELIHDGVIRISYFNVALANYLKRKATELLRDISGFPLELQRMFLRAFYNDEGCIDFNGNIRRVRGYQYNDAILCLIHRLLGHFGIASTLRKQEVTISRKENLERFAREINFSTGVCVNGKRSNSIWKQSLEKREILQRALASYRAD